MQAHTRCLMCGGIMKLGLVKVDTGWGAHNIKLINVRGYSCTCGHSVFHATEVALIQTICEAVASSAPDVTAVTLHR